MERRQHAGGPCIFRRVTGDRMIACVWRCIIIPRMRRSRCGDTVSMVIALIIVALSNAHRALACSQGSRRPYSDVDVPVDFNRRLDELEARLNRLQRRDQAPWLGEARTREMRALVQDMLVDADQRVSLLASKSAAGYEPGHGFFLNGN